MQFNLRKRKRSDRVASLELPPGQWERAWIGLSRRDVLGRIGLALLSAVAICVVIHGWYPPFPYRTSYTPSRDVIATVDFGKVDDVATQAAREKARSQTQYIYAHDPQPLAQLRAQLRNTLVGLTAVPTLDKLDPKLRREFLFVTEGTTTAPAAGEEVAPATDAQNAWIAPPTEEQQKQFLAFRDAFTPQESLDRIEKALADAFAPFEARGLLDKLSDKNGPGNQEDIVTYPVGHPGIQQTVRVTDVLLGDGNAIREALRRNSQLAPVADRLFAWLQPRLKALRTTLNVDDQLTKEAMDRAEDAVGEVFEEYSVGQTLAKAGEPFDQPVITLLRIEYDEAISQRSVATSFARAVAVTCLVFVGLLLCGVHMRFRQRGPLASLTRLVVLLLMAIATVALARLAGLADPWRAELVPLLLFSMIIAIVYRQELAMSMSGVVALIIVLAIGQGLLEFVLLAGTVMAVVLNLGRIRSRKKLIFVGLFAAIVTVLLTILLGMVNDQPLNRALIQNAAYNGLWAIVAALFMEGLLPFVEQFFGILTDLSLLVLGDVAHPLLQELVRRAPSTYNHSITVGSIAEAAAESIYARGLLVRVGAYFHDIGKMLKPDYFVENQGTDENRHQALAPAMSTLVIIAHLKDGADLARQHRLPQPIVDLIAQHHGTTRVEFFYGLAAAKQQADPNGGEVDESRYRYPGPKPQTKEAAVLMLADAVESASRTLVDPTPARIENLVREIAEKRLHDGQFDESGLTLRELRTIEKSLVMSLTSIYHGRIKYPDQKTV